MSGTISITWNDGVNPSDVYTHELSDANYDRVLTYFRNRYGTANAESGLFEQASKNKARKEATRETIQGWKDFARKEEQRVAVVDAAENVPPIDSTEV